jgi:hypothetical protein
MSATTLLVLQNQGVKVRVRAAGVWTQELTFIPSTGPCAGIFRGVNPLISLMLVGNALVYLSVPSAQYIQLHSLNSVACTATQILVFSITSETCFNQANLDWRERGLGLIACCLRFIFPDKKHVGTGLLFRPGRCSTNDTSSLISQASCVR